MIQATRVRECGCHCEATPRRTLGDALQGVDDLQQFASGTSGRASLLAPAFFHQLGITLRSVTEPIDDSPTGKLIEGILAATAQFDNDVKAERTRAGMLAAVSAGRQSQVLSLTRSEQPSSEPLSDNDNMARMNAKSFDV